MNLLIKYVGGAVVAAVLAVVLALYVFSMPIASAVQTGLLSAAVALAVTHLNERRTESNSGTGHN